VRSARAAGVVFLVGAAALAPPALAAPTTTPAFACAAVSHVTGAAVNRFGSPLGPRTFSLPPRVRIVDATRAQTLARLVCSLPQIPHGVIVCPADTSLRYGVTFTGAGGRVNIDPYGCQMVSGAGPPRWAARAHGFWPRLGALLGYGTTDLSSFQGRRA